MDTEDQEALISSEDVSQTSSEQQEPLSQKLKLLTAAAIFYGNITFGCALNFYGPVATSMQNKYNTDDATISKVFSILTGCYMIGALCASFAYNFVNRQLGAILLLATMGTVMFVTPHCETMTLYFVTAGVMGICTGLYDVGQFVWMMEMMQKDCPPYIQSQQFCYALGTILPSLILAPFLNGNKENFTTTTPSPSMIEYEHQYGGFDNIVEVLMEADEGIAVSRIITSSNTLITPYTIVGCLLLIAMTLQILLFIFLRYHKPPPEESSEGSAVATNSKNAIISVPNRKEQLMVGTWPVAKLKMVILSCCMYGAYQGMEMTTFQFFPKFGQNCDLKLSESESTYVLSVMNTAFAAGRGVAIFAVLKISTQLILCVNLVLTLIANILLLGWASSNLEVLWISSILYGIGFSSCYGALSAYIERYMAFTNLLGSLMIVSGSGVASIYPLVVGHFIENNPIVLGYVILFSISVLAIAFSLLSYMTFKDKTRY